MERNFMGHLQTFTYEAGVKQPNRPRNRAKPFRLAALVLGLCWQSGQAWAQNAFVQNNLVSDIPGMAANTDTNLVNPWGIAFSGNSPFWISDNHAGVSTLYNSSGTPQSLVVTIPT